MEIERKFIVPENFRKILEENGFNFVKEFEEVLHDEYIDTQGHHLLHMVQSPPVRPDWAIFWTLGNLLKPLATINLPHS